MLVTLDFETYYDKNYTLKKIATSEYIRHKLFEAISCSIKIDNEPPLCYFGEDIRAALDEIDWSKVTLLCHHTQFDGLILSHHYNIVPKRYACTLSMARALLPKVEGNDLDSVAKYYNCQNKLEMPNFKGKHYEDLSDIEIAQITVYNNGDVESTYQIYQKMLEKFPEPELDIIDMTIRMFTNPILEVDIKKAKDELAREIREKEKAISESGVSIEVLSSANKFKQAVEDTGFDMPMKPSPSVPGKWIPAAAKTDEEFQAMLDHPDERVAKLARGRLAAKSTISESRAARMILYGSDGKKLPIYYNYAKAHTLRWSGGDKFNPQNFKQKKKAGGALRECIIAPKGKRMVIIDSSQIEARVLAWLAGEEWILDAFRNKRDLYSEFASDAYGRLITKEDKEERFVGKTCILGLGFSMSGPKLQKSILTQSIAQGLAPVDLPINVCYDLVKKYRNKCPAIVKLWEIANDLIIGAMLSGKEFNYKCLRVTKEAIHLPNGLTLRYPGLNAEVTTSGPSDFFPKKKVEEKVTNASYMSEYGKTHIYGALIVENIVQALARIIISEAMLEIGKYRRIVMITHDEIVFLTLEKDADNDYKWGVKVMSKPPNWAPNIPLDAEGGHDVCYSK